MGNNVFKISDHIFQGLCGNLSIDSQWLQRIENHIKSNESYPEPQAARDTTDRMRGVSILPVDSSGKDPSALGVIDVRGVLLYSSNDFWENYGYTGYNLLEARLAALMNDPSIKTIVLRVQSPGGTTFGVSELSQKIYDARSQKKIVAYADPYAFSAAYWLASSAQSFYMIKSGMVGSIGAYTMHIDYSKAMEEAGLKVTFIKAGEKKVDGNPYEPLSARALSDIQAEVDRFYELFVADVARNRGQTEAYVKEHFGKAGRVSADEALTVGMVDGIMGFDDVLNMELTALREQNTLAQGKAYLRAQKNLLELED